MSETEKISLYRDTGDLELLGELYQHYMPLIYGLCLKYFKDEERSKDAVMQIFEQLISKLRFHPVSNFKSWLYTLARNYCLMELRHTSKHEFVSIDENMENAMFTHLTSEGDSENEIRRMKACMEKLSEEQRVCVDLFYLQQKCYKEVSDLTGFEASKVKSYIQNGKRNLKICMEKNSGKDS